ncbi:unnamed protein product [Brachionus calyciflorus]|uniref:Ig-like domain-containing protein n=1 Tax=Brachionus calyciflorus TaxID=104777 RepID=A0A813M9G4_9BILA|nr:unnamed protein product [Brachionus calyciflorus]
MLRVIEIAFYITVNLISFLNCQLYSIDSVLTRIKEEPTYYTVRLGETVTIPCTIENRKSANVIWQLSKTKIPETLTVGIQNYRKDFRVRVISNTTLDREQSWNLEIRKVRFDDEGFYLCKVMAEPESLKRSIYLKVEVDLRLNIINNVINLDDNVILSCNTTNFIHEKSKHFGVHKITWFKENDLIGENKDKTNLTLSNYRIEHYHRPAIGSRLIITKFLNLNIGEYKCVFRNQSVSLYVGFKSAISRRIFEFGNSSSTKCNVNLFYLILTTTLGFLVFF